MNDAKSRREPKQHHHVLFHFDQEPLWSTELGSLYDSKLYNVQWSTKHAKLLANSEHSSIKKLICRERHMLDWYFFFHGFAALDWFGDSQYISDWPDFSKVFCSMNHLINDYRAYRMALTARLIKQGSHRFGDISFHGTYKDCEIECRSPDSLLSCDEKKLVMDNLSQIRLPLTLENKPMSGNFSAHYGVEEHRLWSRSLWHVVNETVFFHDKLHLTEKIFKPIVTCRPFLLVGAVGNLDYLRSYGFRTFDRWIDETYDLESNPTRRLDMIAVEIGKLCAKSRSDLVQMYEEMMPTLEYNKKHFFGKFKEIIVHEMIDNFDTCIRVWNNGRVDSRTVPFHPDLASAKRSLMR